MAASINTETTSILNDSRGEDVRDSFVSALKKIAMLSLPDVNASDNDKILAISDDGKWSAMSYIPSLSDLDVTIQPTKTSYVQGEMLDFTGLVITATYTADLAQTITQDVTSLCTFSPANGSIVSETGDLTVTATYTEDGKEYSTNFTLNVETYVTSLIVTTQPTRTVYMQGDSLDLSGTVISAVYSDGTREVVTDQCIFSPDDESELDTIGVQFISVSYTKNNVTVTTSISVTVSEAVILESIGITVQPTKTRYNNGEALDLTGVVVTATYSDDSTADVTDSCSFIPINGAIMTTSQTSEVIGISVQYTERGVTKFDTITVTVVKVGIEVTTMPYQTVYNETNGYEFDSSGLVIIFTNENGVSSDVTSQCILDTVDGTIFSTPDEGHGEYLATINVEYINNFVNYYTFFRVTVEY